MRPTLSLERKEVEVDVILKAIKYINSITTVYSGVGEAYATVDDEHVEVLFRWIGGDKWIYIRVSLGRLGAGYSVITGWMSRQEAMGTLERSSKEYVYYKGESHV